MKTKNKNLKFNKNIMWFLIGIIGIGIIGVSGWIIYDYIKKPKEITLNTKTESSIKFETNDESVARAFQYDVGQADAGLVQISKDNSFTSKDDNFNILIDVGVPNNSSNVIKQNLIDKISNSNVRNVDLMVFTHLHYDHIGAASYLLKSNLFTFDKTVTLFNWSEANYFGNKLSKTALTLLEDLKTKNISLADSNYWSNQKNNKIIDFGNNNYFSVLGSANIPTQKNNQNAWSIVNRFQWNNQSILYTGDLVGETKSGNIPNTIPLIHRDELDVDILKSPHHGSSTEGSNDNILINAVSPSQIWISAGNNDQYTLPDVATLNTYIKYLPNNNPALIKGTEIFGKNITQIKKENPINPPETQIEYENRVNLILNKWKPLNDWVINNPTVNNNNKSYGDISYTF